jgi:hypothetical protein
MTRPNRLDPAMPAGSYKTYQLSAPRSTHFRPATCADVDCEAYLFGWQTTIDESTDLGRRQADYIRHKSARHFIENQDGRLTVFTFEPGQTCFAQHQVRLERPPLFIVRGGDWRGNPRGEQPRYHSRPEFWVEDFADHQAKLAEQLEKG